MSEKTLDRRRLFTLAGAAGVTGVALASGLALPARAQSAGATFVPISPYRSLDSRPYKIETNQIVDIDLVTDENLNPRIPTTALAVTYNLTVAETEGTGFLAMFPAATGWPGNSSINWWTSNLLLANGGVVALGASAASGPGSVSFACGGGGKTAFLVDITGYYL